MTLPASSAPRWDLIAELIGPATSVLDIGCRDKALRGHLAPGARYVGLDLGEGADVVASAEDPLPFEDGAFEVAVLADVLEHLDRPHAALREAIRVSSAGAVVLLPNLYHYRSRIAVLRGRPLGKYRMGASEVVDRHRWYLHFDDARAFCQGVAAEAGWRVTAEYAHDGGPRHPATRTVSRVLRAVSGPSLWAYEYAARLGP